MTNQRNKRWLLEALYIIGMMMLFILAIRLVVDSAKLGLSFLAIASFVLLTFFGLLYLKWFKLWEYEEYEDE